MSSPSTVSSTRPVLLMLLAVIALAVATTTLTAADHPQDQDANQGGTGLTEWTGTWEVGSDDDLAYANQTIDLDGNLVISDGGRLVLMNVTIIMHGGELDPQEIRVHEGELVITDLDGDPASSPDASYIKANDTDYPYYFQAYAESILELTNSFIRDCGRKFNVMGFEAGVYIATDDATVSGMAVHHGYGGLFLDSTSISVEDCNIHHNEWVGVFVDNGATPTLRGCTIEDNVHDGIVVKHDSQPVLRDCSVRGNLKGVVLDSAFMSAHGTVISGNELLDIEMPYFGQADLFNCTLSVSAANPVVFLDNSSLTSTGGNFDIDEVEMLASTFHYRQFLTVVVTWADSQDTPIPDVPVKIENYEGDVITEFTDGNGRVHYLPMLVREYDKTSPGLKTFNYNPFEVTVTHDLVDKSDYADLRDSEATLTFKYPDTEDPVAVAPTLSEVDIGVEIQLDGSGSHDNVAIETWNWSFDEFGAPVYLEGEKVNHTFREAKTYSVKLRVVDTSNNTGPNSLVSFEVVARDRIPPLADAGPNRTAPQGTVVTLDGSNSTDNVGIVEYTWSFTYDGAPRSLTGRVVTWKFDIPGVYIVALVVMDEAGLSGSDSATIRVLDTVPPVTSVVFNPVMPPDRKYTEQVQIVFTSEDVGSPSPDLNYRINDDDWQTVVGGIALSFGGDLQYGDGTYTIDYYGVDAAGNTEEVQTIAPFVVDATQPTFEDMDPPVTPYTVTNETYTITGRTEPGATLTINNAEVAVGEDGTFSHDTMLQLGENPFVLQAVDRVGHTADLTRMIVREEYEPVNGGGDGSNTMVYVALGAVIVIVVLVLLVWMFVLNKDREEGGGEPPLDY